MQRIPPPRPRLEVRDLELVLALAAAGSTAGAASRLHLTQSAVSRALLQAEDRLGARLFERSARGLAPTPAGDRLIEGAGAVLAQLSALEELAAAGAAPKLRVRLVCECYTAYRWLPTTLAKLRKSLPGLEIELAVDHTQDPVSGLLSGDIDIALLTNAELRPGLRERPLFTDEIVFVLSPSHPLAARPALSPADLCSTPLITSHTPPAEAKAFQSRVFGRKKPRLEYLRFPITEAIADAARAGLGVAVLSEWIASGYVGSGDLVIRRLSSGPILRPWRVAFRPEAAHAAERLSQALEGAAPRVHAPPAEPPRRAPLRAVR